MNVLDKVTSDIPITKDVLIYNTSLMKRASLRSTALIKLGSLSLVCVIFLPPWSPSLSPWPYFLPT